MVFFSSDPVHIVSELAHRSANPPNCSTHDVWVTDCGSDRGRRRDRGGAKFCVGFTEEDALCVASDLEAVAIVVLGVLACCVLTVLYSGGRRLGRRRKPDRKLQKAPGLVTKETADPV